MPDILTIEYYKALEALGEHLNDVLGPNAKHWLDATNMALGNITPRSLLGTLEGIKQVDDVLFRIEHGVFS